MGLSGTEAIVLTTLEANPFSLYWSSLYFNAGHQTHSNLCLALMEVKTLSGSNIVLGKGTESHTAQLIRETLTKSVVINRPLTHRHEWIQMLGNKQ